MVGQASRGFGHVALDRCDRVARFQPGTRRAAPTDDIGDDETPASAGDVDVATRIDVGFLHACATLDSGAVRCWGRGSTGALGYGNTRSIGDDEAPPPPAT